MAQQNNLFSDSILNPANFSVEPGDFIKWKGEPGVVMAMYDHVSGRTPMRVIMVSDGREAMPFLDEVELVKKTITAGPAHEISDETAARFAAYARSR